MRKSGSTKRFIVLNLAPVVREAFFLKSRIPRFLRARDPYSSTQRFPLAHRYMYPSPAKNAGFGISQNHRGSNCYLFLFTAIPNTSNRAPNSSVPEPMKARAG